MNIAGLLDRGAIAPRASATSQRQALNVIAEIAGRTFGLKAPHIFDALVEREEASSTGVGYGVAVPHAHLEGLDRIRGVFVRLEQPVEFAAVDDRPVDLFFALFAPPSTTSEHLRALARVSRLLRRPEIREQLRKARTIDAIYALLSNEVRPSAA